MELQAFTAKIAAWDEEKEMTATNRKETFIERFVRRILTTVGRTFDRLTGRGRSQIKVLPTTSDLADQLRQLLDSQVRDLGNKGRFAPHEIRLRIESAHITGDYSSALRAVEHELMATAIEHINDNRYRTFAPLSVQIKPDIFIEGIRLSVGYGQEDETKSVATQISNLGLNLNQPGHQPQLPQNINDFNVNVAVEIMPPNGPSRTVQINFSPNQGRLNVGRTKENGLALPDGSVSKIHASLVMNPNGQLFVADTGSTNGTYINGQRIAYGKACEVLPTDTVGFGDVQVKFSWQTPEPNSYVSVTNDSVSFTPAPVGQTESKTQNTFQFQVKSIEDDE